VALRVGEGGHDVPEDKIRERYERNQPLIRQAVLLADQAVVFDNSRLNVSPLRAIWFRNGRVVGIAPRLPEWARMLYGAELAAYEPDAPAAGSTP
jgi:predicted ABC-type ATPase